MLDICNLAQVFTRIVCKLTMFCWFDCSVQSCRQYKQLEVAREKTLVKHTNEKVKRRKMQSYNHMTGPDGVTILP